MKTLKYYFFNLQKIFKKILNFFYNNDDVNFLSPSYRNNKRKKIMTKRKKIIKPLQLKKARRPRKCKNLKRYYNSIYIDWIVIYCLKFKNSELMVNNELYKKCLPLKKYVIFIFFEFFYQNWIIIYCLKFKNKLLYHSIKFLQNLYIKNCISFGRNNNYNLIVVNNNNCFMEFKLSHNSLHYVITDLIDQLYPFPNKIYIVGRVYTPDLIKLYIQLRDYESKKDFDQLIESKSFLYHNKASTFQGSDLNQFDNWMDIDFIDIFIHDKKNIWQKK